MKHTFLLLDKFDAVTRGLRELTVARFAQMLLCNAGYMPWTLRSLRLS